MNPEKFIEVFDTVAEAPGGIERLRELVLQLAVRGKLVPQDAGDEPASELLRRAKTAKSQEMIKRKIRRGSEPELSESAGEASSPTHWVWTHLYDFALVLGGKRLPAGASFSTEKTGNIYIRVTDMKNGSISAEDLRYISDDVQAGITKYTIDREDLYITIAGTIGEVGDVPEQFHGQNLTENAAKIVFRKVDKEFLLLVLRSGDVKEQFQDKMKQMAQPKLALKRISGARVPIPPLAEQHRIVAKVDKLMGLVDRLEAARRSREAVRASCRDSALAALRNANTSEGVVIAWTRIAERMDNLFTVPADLEPLREAVLQLAVQGRLVPQDTEDEPATVLVDHIAKERTKLIRAKKIGKQKPAPDLAHSATAVELPKGWTWTCTATLGIVNPRNLADDDSLVSFCPMPAIPTGYRQRIAPEIRRWSDIKKGYTHFAEGDVVVAKITPCFQNRKSCVMTELEGGIGSGTTELHVIRIIANKVVPEYLLLFYKSPDFVQMGVATMTGTAGQQRVPREYFAYTPLPLPPLAEQRRIVAKVDELMGLIDRLEQHLVAKGKFQKVIAAAPANQSYLEN